MKGNIKYHIISEDEEGDRFTIDLYINNERIGKSTFELISYPCEGLYDDELYDVLLKYEKYASLETLSISGSFKGNGYGTKLFKKTLDFVEAKGYDKAYLNACPIGNDGLPLDLLVKFYEKFGFKTVIKEKFNEEMVL